MRPGVELAILLSQPLECQITGTCRENLKSRTGQLYARAFYTRELMMQRPRNTEEQALRHPLDIE